MYKKFLLMLAIIMQACNMPTDNHHTIKMTDKETEILTIDIDNMKLIRLETDSASVLSDVTDVNIEDGNYYILSDSKLKVFDGEGKYLFTMAHKGNGYGETNFISNFFIKDNEVCVFDNNLGLFFFSKSGNFLRKEQFKAEMRPSVAPYRLYPHMDGYISVNHNLNGSDLSASALSFWSDSLSFKNTINGLIRNTGMFFADGLSQSTDRILYWEPYPDSVYIIENNKVAGVFALDMGKFKLPEDIVNPVEKLFYINDNYKNKSFVGLPMFFQMKNEKLYFMCIYPIEDNKNAYCLCEYSPDNDKLRVFAFQSTHDLVVGSFCKLIDEYFLLTVRDNNHVDYNPYLLLFPIKTLEPQ